LLGDLWRVNLEDASKGNVTWEEITKEPLNKPEYNFSHHCAVAYKNKIFVYGGMRIYNGRHSKLDRALVKCKN